MNDRLHSVLCAAGYPIRWLLKMIAKKGVPFFKRFYLRLRLAATLSSKWSRILRNISAHGFTELTPWLATD